MGTKQPRVSFNVHPKQGVPGLSTELKSSDMMSTGESRYAIVLVVAVSSLFLPMVVDANGTLVYIDPLAEMFQQQIVQLHNTKRRLVTEASNMKKMSWDADLEVSMRTYLRRCIFGHENNLHIIGEGENLAVSIDGFDTIFTSITDAWYNEVNDYTYESNSCASGEQCGHYTQMVWANTARVGCAVAQCSVIEFSEAVTNGWLFGCRYRPPGNVAGSRPYQLGTPCSGCPEGYECDDGLCEETGTVETTTPAALPPDTTQETTTAPPVTTTTVTDSTLETTAGSTQTQNPGTTASTATDSVTSTTSSPTQETTTSSPTACPTATPTSCSAQYEETLKEYKQYLEEWLEVFRAYQENAANPYCN